MKLLQARPIAAARQCQRILMQRGWMTDSAIVGVHLEVDGRAKERWTEHWEGDWRASVAKVSCRRILLEETDNVEREARQVIK